MNGILHPGLEVALRRFEMTETDVARALASGEMTSPTHFVNAWYFRLRISGTGFAYRPQLREYVERLPEHYVTTDFLERCNGLPVVWLHPDAQVLDTKSFGNQVVGTIVLPYIGGPDGEDPTSQEVWGVARIIDEKAAHAMSAMQLSTSPAVVLTPGESEEQPMEGGAHLLREGKPYLLDHLAICEHGVWDKLGPPTGIDNVNLRADSAHNKGAEAMAEEKEVKEEVKKDEESIKGSKEGEAPDADLKDIFKKVDAMCSMADALCKRMDAWEDEKKADKARRDEEEEEKAKADASAEKEREQSKTLEKLASEEAHEAAEEEAKGDKAKKDEESEEGMVKSDKKGRRDAEKCDEDEEEDKKSDADEEEKEMKADARVDALMAKLDAQSEELEELKRKVAERPTADSDAMADAQAKADSVYSSLGERAPAPMLGESVMGYRIRLTRGLQKHASTDARKKADVAKMARHDSDLFAELEASIYADATSAARDPNVLGDGEGLRQRVRIDSVTGQRMIEWYGNPLAWMSRFMPADQFCTRLGPQPRQ